MSIKTDGTIWAWGLNNRGQLGDDTVSYRSSPVQIGALTNWAQVSAGDLFTASVKTDGTLWAWGDNGRGQLGIGTAAGTYRSSPVQIGALTTWSQVSAGAEHTAAIKTDGTMWAWGGNISGEVGDGTTVSRSSPVQVGALTTWAQVAGGSVHTVAIKTD